MKIAINHKIQPIICVVHDGTFHADDTMCVALLRYCFIEVKVIRAPRADSAIQALHFIKKIQPTVIKDDFGEKYVPIIVCDYGMVDQSQHYQYIRAEDESIYLHESDRPTDKYLPPKSFKNNKLIIIDHHHEDCQGAACLRLLRFLYRNQLLSLLEYNALSPLIDVISQHDEGVKLQRQIESFSNLMNPDFGICVCNWLDSIIKIVSDYVSEQLLLPLTVIDIDGELCDVFNSETPKTMKNRIRISADYSALKLHFKVREGKLPQSLLQYEFPKDVVAWTHPNGFFRSASFTSYEQLENIFQDLYEKFEVVKHD